MEHKHVVRDRDARFVIDPITKAVKNTSKKMTIAQYSHNSERITFEIPRLVEEHDMSSCTAVEIHYQNIDAKTKENRSGYYAAEDLQVDPEDESKVICSWLISGSGTKAPIFRPLLTAAFIPWILATGKLQMYIGFF